MSNPTIKITGQAVIGHFKGVKQRSITNRTTGEISTLLEAGIATYLDDGFGGTTEEIMMVSLSRDQITKGVASKLERFIGKTVILPVWYRAYATKTGAAMNAYLTNDWEQTIFVVPDQPLQKVG